MNKIYVNEDKIDIKSNDDIKITLENSDKFLNVLKIKIECLKDAKLEIEILSSSSKFDIDILVNKNVNLEIFELKQNSHIKTQYKYRILENSYLKIFKFYDDINTNEVSIINLDGINASVDFTLKTIALHKQTYHMIVNHNFKNTKSNIINNGVNIKGGITFDIEGVVLNDIVDCELNQNSKIVTFNDDYCNITPKFLISENDVVANHSALIGKFSESEMFYLMSRGISEKEANILLVKGFLLNNINDERLLNIIEKYWR